MLGIRYGYYTTDPMIAWQIDSLVDYSQEIYSKFAEFVWIAMPASNAHDGLPDD